MIIKQMSFGTLGSYKRKVITRTTNIGALYDIGILFDTPCCHILQHIMMNEIVTVNKKNIFSCRYLQSTVAGIRQTSILFVNDLDAFVRRCVFVTYLRTAIWRAIINQD